MSPSDIAYTPILPDGWSRPRGFSHAVVAKGTKSVRIAGQIGREPGQAHIAPGTDAGTQWRVALGNVVAVLKAAGGEPGHLVMLRAYVTDIAEFNRAGAAIGAAWGATLGKHFPAMTLVQVSALIDPNAKVEIEGEAILP
jgi:enamine deaminase RidA (YjgF/YER057c/UK114 family)